MKRNRKILLILLLTMVCGSSVAQNTDRIDFVVRHVSRKAAVKHASFSVCVHNISKDSTIYSRNDDMAMVPAAINKLFAERLFTAGTALINREEDIGLEGLRRAKLSYYPLTILDKYHVTSQPAH